MSPVSRLKKTWSKVKTAKFDILEVNLIDRLNSCLSNCIGVGERETLLLVGYSAQTLCANMPAFYNSSVLIMYLNVTLAKGGGGGGE